MEDRSEVRKIGDWTARVRIPDGHGLHPVLLLLHGLTGDESITWIFTPRLPQEALLIAPRGLYSAGSGGYSWYPDLERPWPGIDDLRPAISALSGLLTEENFPSADFSRLSGLGFSQGAALLYSLALLEPQRVRAFAGLAGFLPEGSEAFVAGRPLEGKHAFVAHGTQDERVPIERARRAVELLEEAGAQVTYCEDEVGHKLSANCFRGLGSFFRANSV